MDARSEDSIAARRRKIFWYAAELGLTRQDRHDLAQYLLRRDITSWKQLDDAQVSRLLDAFEGHELLNQLVLDRHG